MFVGARRLATRPIQAAGRTGRILVEDEVARVVDAVLESAVPEAIARSLAEHRVIGRVATELADSSSIDDELDRILRRDETAELVERVADLVLSSPRVRKALVDVAESPELRRVLAEQSRGFGSELASLARRRAEQADVSTEGVLHLKARSSDRIAGIATRAAALTIDAVLAQLLFLVAAGSIVLVTSLAGGGNASLATRATEGAAWLLSVTLYFSLFWSSGGQTPGMRMLGLRVATVEMRALSFKRALVRAIGLLLAIAPACAGFLPALFTRRRRALQDYLAGTVVIYADGGTTPRPRTRPRAAGRTHSTDPPLRSTSSEVDGVRVHALVGGEGPPVVLMHGFAVSGSYMRPLAQRLVADFHVLVPDLPGDGRPAASSVPALAKRLAAWLEQSGPERPIVVANSLGCQVVTALAVSRPDLVGPLVLVGPSVDPTRRTARHQIFDLLRDSAREPAKLVAVAARDAATNNVAWLAAVARSALSDRIEQRLPHIHVPVVVVHGGKDPFVTRAWAEQAASLAPDGRLVVAPSEGHAVHFTDPECVAAIVRELQAARELQPVSAGRSHPAGLTPTPAVARTLWA